MTEDIFSLTDKVKSLLERIKALEAMIDDKDSEIADLESELCDAQDTIDDLKSEIHDLKNLDTYLYPVKAALKSDLEKAGFTAYRETITSLEIGNVAFYWSQNGEAVKVSVKE